MSDTVALVGLFLLTLMLLIGTWRLLVGILACVAFAIAAVLTLA